MLELHETMCRVGEAVMESKRPMTLDSVREAHPKGRGCRVAQLVLFWERARHLSKQRP